MINDAAKQILCNCDPSYDPNHRYQWCGRERTDVDRIVNDATNSERHAAMALVKDDKRSLIVALWHLDRDAWSSVSAYSHSAKRTDFARMSGTGVNRAEREELTALETMCEPRDRWSNLRQRIIDRLLELGVKLVAPYCLKCADDHYVAYRSWDALRRHPEHNILKEEMRNLGLTS